MSIYVRVLVRTEVQGDASVLSGSVRLEVAPGCVGLGGLSPGQRGDVLALHADLGQALAEDGPGPALVLVEQVLSKVLGALSEEVQVGAVLDTPLVRVAIELSLAGDHSSIDDGGSNGNLG